MSLLDGLKDSLKNPLAENNDEMEFILESDFETALEKAIDVKLSPADIAAILNGDDDIDDEEDDLDDLDDDIDKDTIDDLQKAKEALEATMTEIGIDTAADELDEDDDTGDLDMDPEGEDEIISEEALIEMIDALGCDDAQELPGDEAKITKKADTGEASIPENLKDPTPDGDEHQIKKDEEALEALIAALESDDKPEIDNDPSATECDTTETGAAGTLANADDATPNGDTEEPAGAENDAKDEECDTNACESKKEDSDDDSDDEDSDDDESDDDEDEKKKDKKCKKEDSDDDSDDDESDECSLESILDSLLENPI